MEVTLALFALPVVVLSLWVVLRVKIYRLLNRHPGESILSRQPSRLRKIASDDIASAQTVILLGVPINLMVCVFILTQFAYGDYASGGPDQTGSFARFVGFSGWLQQLPMVVATLAHSCWWVYLRRRDVDHAIVYVIAVWVTTRAVWFLSLWVFSTPNAEFLGVLSGYVVGIPWAVIAAAVAIAVSAVSTKMAISGRSASRIWCLLMLTTPFVSLSFVWDVTYVGAALPVDLFFSMSAFAFIAAIENSRVVHFYKSPWLFPERTKGKFLDRMQHNAIPLLTAVALIIAVTYFASEILGPEAQFHDSERGVQILLKLITIAVTTTAMYLIGRAKQTRHQALKWAMVVWFYAAIMCSLFIGQYQPIFIYSIIPVVFSVFFALIALAVSIGFERWRAASAFGLSVIWPGLLYAVMASALELGNDQFIFRLNYLGWVDLSMTTAILFFLVYYVLGPAGILNDNPPSDPRGETVETGTRNYADAPSRWRAPAP
ncbi:MAG: hypothetical protein OXC83_07475 [Chloroflexi bacterium]|nr:hypothetical protein [Chloroflexota bacterium]